LLLHIEIKVCYYILKLHFVITCRYYMLLHIEITFYYYILKLHFVITY